MTKILSLDGGGTWALLQTRALAELYPGETGHQILRRFDFAFGNSGGSLVLGGLMADMTPAAIAAYFTESVHRKAMYVRSPFIFSWILRQFGAGSRYSTPAKRAKLASVFPGREFASLRHGDGHVTHVVIVAFDYVRSRAFLFRGAPSPRFPTTEEVALADVIHASTTAPVLYYDRPAEFDVTVKYPADNARPKKMQFWDGGVTGLNNPVAAAVSEAIAAGIAADDIAVLSIGTGTVLRSNNPNHGGDPDQRTPPQDSGPIADLKKLAKAVVGDPPDFASFLAHTMCGGRAPIANETVATQIVRMNPLVLGDFAQGNWVRPGWNVAGANSRQPDLFKRLQDLDMDAADEDNVNDIGTLATAWLTDRAKNQPVRANFFQSPADGLHAEVGHTCFSAAKARARDLGLVP